MSPAARAAAASLIAGQPSSVAVSADVVAVLLMQDVFLLCIPQKLPKLCLAHVSQCWH